METVEARARRRSAQRSASAGTSSTRSTSPRARARRSSRASRSRARTPRTAWPRPTSPASRTSTTSPRRASRAATSACRSRWPTSSARRSTWTTPSRRSGGTNRVRVRSTAGEVEADACVVAVPAGVLDRIAFEPALPEPLRGALALVQYGHAAKLFVPLRTPAAAQRGDERSRALLDLDRHGRRRRAAAGRERLRRLHARARGARRRRRARAAGSTRSAPRDDLELDPTARSSPPGTTTPGCARPTRPRRRRRWRRPREHPAGPLAFAGEHTAGEHPA